MNDNDLERRLRAESGPREQGYVPVRLPASPEEAVQRRPSPVIRAAILVPAVAAGIVAVAVAGAVLRGGDDGGTNLGADPSSSATPTVSSIGGLPVCANDDLTISAEPWRGAAGSRGTVLTVQAVEGHATCALIPSELAAQMSDANGSVLVTSDIPHPMSRDVTTITAGDVHTYSIVWSNWCGDQPATPVDLSVSAGLSLEGATHWKAVSAPGGGDSVPPCLGENQPSRLTVTELQGTQ
jgi:hypothetical protein